ncbi:uncharacterized protein [Palaemon carinicauda]|uniref:uncharacterized protein n=1 Tax=Palaemon carinicauda TaxID=392227 RepID=UPI0035B60A87
MQTKGLLFLWGILASCLVFFADGSTISSFGEIAAKFQKSTLLDTVHFEEPTEQEWIEIFTERLQGKESLPKYLAGKNYTLNVNETGEFHNTEGLKGSWNLTSYMFFHEANNQTLRYILTLESAQVGDTHYESGTHLVTVFTLLDQEYVLASVGFGRNFEKKGDALHETGNLMGFGQGGGVFLEQGQVEFSNICMMLMNRSNVFSMAEQQYGGLITVDKDTYHLDGGLFRNSIPLSTVEVASLPKNPESLASLFRVTKASVPHVAASRATIHGEKTGKEVGTFKADMDGVTSVYPNRTFNTTATLKGTFDNKQTEAHLLIQDLIDISNPFLE